MGRTKEKDKGEKTLKRKRRRKARTDVSSDSSSGEEAEEVQVLKENINVGAEDEDTPMPSGPALEVDEEDDEQEHEQKSAGKFTEKGGRIPSPLRDLHDPQADAKFEEYYMRLVTEEFGDDLNKIREAKDFGDNSLPMLIRALRQGVNIFDPEEKRAVMKEMTA